MVDVRACVARAFRDHAPIHVLVACSGGPDSLALAYLAAEQGHAANVQVSAAVVDHGLQPGSYLVAAHAADQCRAVGITDVHVLTVTVPLTGDGPEASARRARLTALEGCAGRIGADQVWLGHTADDQAETVLIGLTHGSGARSLAGMRPRDGIWVRPLLHCRRSAVHACLPAEVHPWQDPHNADPRFLRSGVRHEVMPVLVDVLGDRAVVNLARTAELLARDNSALDAMAETVFAFAVRHEGHGVTLPVDSLAQQPAAITSRVIRLACLAAGARARDLTMAHMELVTRLLADRSISGPVALPGRLEACRRHDRLTFTPQAGAPDDRDRPAANGQE